MYLLGAHLPDHKLVRIALTSFYGISHNTARRLCARLQLHEAATVSSLTDSQVTQLSAYLSSPGSVPPRPSSPVVPSPLSTSGSQASEGKDFSMEIFSSTPPSQRKSPNDDPLRSIVIESDLKRQMQANIAHHRTIGTYKGRRHQQSLPVRGQRTRSNAQTARKLNRVERRYFGTTIVGSKSNQPSISSIVEPMARLRFSGLRRPSL